jgi:hypothetical protein
MWFLVTYEPSCSPRPIRRRKDRFLTLYDSPRFPRAVFDRFRAQVHADGGAWIDALRQLMERYDRKETGRARESTSNK